jgi:VWFA-related protein
VACTSGRTIVAVTAGMCTLAFSGSAQKVAAPASIDLVELAVVVTDRQRQPVLDLTKQDFEVREDGKPVDITTFLTASASGSREFDQSRSMVVLLDDVMMPPSATDSVKSVAGYLVGRGSPGDDISVVRVNNRADEPYGDLEVALMRISEYEARNAPFDLIRSTEDALKLIANVSSRLEPYGRRRKAIVCIGSQRICNVMEPSRTAPGSLRSDWIGAVRETAKANASVYALTAGRGRLPGGGLVEATGGEVFGSRSDLTPAIEQIWNDLSRHYLIGYWPTASSRDLHSISIKVKRSGVRVLARKRRGS